jgi:glycerophosphoryl diester phosphodiesterase
MSLVISHRGANREAPENTLPAFRRSLALGVDGFENDVHLTKDGRLVVCHDDTIDRTSNGTGLIADHTFAQLRSLDFGGWFAPEFAGTQIPSLEEFYELCGGLKIVNVEIKRAPDGSTAAAAGVIRMAKDYGLFERLIISSFDMDMLLACTAADPAARTAYLYHDTELPIVEELDDDLAAFAKKYHLAAYHPFLGFMTQGYIDECHSHGILVNPWTVNQPHALERLRDWGSDGVITDLPGLAMDVMYGQAK